MAGYINVSPSPPAGGYGVQRERCRSGLTGPPGKRVYLKRVPGVRIPLSPPSLAIVPSNRDDGEFFLWQASADTVRIVPVKACFHKGLRENKYNPKGFINIIVHLILYAVS